LKSCGQNVGEGAGNDGASAFGKRTGRAWDCCATYDAASSILPFSGDKLVSAPDAAACSAFSDPNCLSPSRVNSRLL
jgi:hypothetical protein